MNGARAITLTVRFENGHEAEVFSEMLDHLGYDNQYNSRNKTTSVTVDRHDNNDVDVWEQFAELLAGVNKCQSTDAAQWGMDSSTAPE